MECGSNYQASVRVGVVRVSGTSRSAEDRTETSGGEEHKRIAKPGEVGTMPLRGLAALLFFGGIVYALLSGNWGIGAIAFSLGVVVLGLDRLRRVGLSRPDRAVGWVLVLCGALTLVFIAIRMALGVA